MFRSKSEKDHEPLLDNHRKVTREQSLPPLCEYQYVTLQYRHVPSNADIIAVAGLSLAPHRAPRNRWRCDHVKLHFCDVVVR